MTLAEALVVAVRVVDLPPAMFDNKELCQLLDSAFHSPQATFDGNELYPELCQKAAVLCRHICLNHPFPDGNKRMAWILTDLFLRMNGHHLYEDDVRAICVMVEIASSQTTAQEIEMAFSKWVLPMETALA